MAETCLLSPNIFSSFFLVMNLQYSVGQLAAKNSSHLPWHSSMAMWSCRMQAGVCTSQKCHKRWGLYPSFLISASSWLECRDNGWNFSSYSGPWGNPENRIPDGWNKKETTWSPVPWAFAQIECVHPQHLLVYVCFFYVQLVNELLENKGSCVILL